MRGFACLLMFEVHSYDSWLGGAARESRLMKWSQLSGTIPAPLFLFLAGVSIALVSDKMRKKGITPNQIARTTILRGAEILGLGLLFRLQEYLLGLPWAPWTDLLRVDILNTIGISIMLLGIVGRLTQSRAANAAVALITTAAIALATPFLYTTWRPRWLPWYLESYINGVHIYDSPRPWLFPIFPWAGFAFAGLALGYLLFSDWGKNNLRKNHAGVRRRRRGIVLSFKLARRTVPAALSRVRLLAHQPEFLSRARGHHPRNCFRQLRMVSLGTGPGGIQPHDPDGTNFFARLLGAHRIRLRKIFNFEKRRRVDSHGHARPLDHHHCDGAALHRANHLDRSSPGNNRVV